MVVGGVALSVLAGWTLAGAVVAGFPPLNAFVPLLNSATMGALVGLLVGVYDVRGLERQWSLGEVNRINDTLRIATQELVSNSDRGVLEQAVCDRLRESDPYEAAWVGRNDPDAGQVLPVAWAGFDDEYFESLVVTVDDTPTGEGAGGRAVKTGEIQCVPDVFTDETMEPWWDLFEMWGVESLSIVPIRGAETIYGFISIYADRPSVFEEREQEALSELGETIGHAIDTIETRERLAKRERELARQNERLEEFAGVVSHDLRNPLNVADGYLDLAREEGDDRYFDRVAEALVRMGELVDDLLTLARQGATVDEFREVPFEDVVTSAWETAGSTAATLRVDGDLGVVSCDRSRLRELLENLFRNSLEHGRPDVTVTVRRTAGVFAVADDGPGIPADERDAVFETGYSTNDDGTGFGLNIVRSVAEPHGWGVSLDESSTGGVRFEFTGVESGDRTEPAVGAS